MPIKFSITIEQIKGDSCQLTVHTPPQVCTDREAEAHRQLNQLLARFALEITARTAEKAQGGN